MNAIIRLDNVSKTYPNPAGEVRALKGVSLEIEPGCFIAITGRSGSGKTTLINLLTGLDHPGTGEIWVDGKAVHKMSEGQAAAWRGRQVGVVFQSFHLIPTITALQNVTLPMDFARRGSLRQRRERALALLAELEIAEQAHKRPAQVSGGQQQRIAIARALANDPAIIAADEPTGSLDSATARSVIAVFKTLAAQGKTVVMVTHDPDLAAEADRTMRLWDGEFR